MLEVLVLGVVLMVLLALMLSGKAASMSMSDELMLEERGEGEYGLREALRDGDERGEDILMVVVGGKQEAGDASRRVHLAVTWP